MAATASTPGKHVHVTSVNDSLRPARALLSEWTLSRYLATRPPSHVLTLETEMTLGAALAALHRHRMLSAPVAIANGDVVGFLSVRDAVAAFLAGVYPGLLRGSTSDTASLADDIAAAGTEFCERELRAIAYGGDGQLLFKARTTASLYDVAQGFLLDAARPQHRVAVWDLGGGFDAQGDDAMRVTGVVSQTDLVRFLVRHATDLGDLCALPLDAVGLAMKRVVTLPASTTALQAFAAMAAAGVSAAGITSAVGGPLVANLSASDLRGITASGWGLLALPVTDFIMQQNSKAAPDAHGSGAAISPLHSVRPSSTLGDALAKFDARGVHHLWVLDDDHKPLGIITPTDVLKVRRRRRSSRAALAFRALTEDAAHTQLIMHGAL